ncbi:FtsK/SpoIIIE domain-containing protein [Ornithinibacillus scapharcae]|uniref:FtsK/SpoIIIE domain-containing protein n=1 Tax=Ornithinibacillus scapharcae TaxID=1147159 RepID=UPI000225B051|nr:FtsK/SpoIIIE domain-containing protein [Ornithinibacillus scapharcae]
MIMEIAWATLIGSVVYGSAPYVYDGIKKSSENSKLRKAFLNGELFLKRKDEKIKIKPNILKTKISDDKMTFVFSIPKGVNPEKFVEKSYVFKQHFNDYIDLKVESKRGILNVYPKGLPREFKYKFEDIDVSKQKLPIVCGMNLAGKLFTYDMVTHPHLLIAGETGSGKSSMVRSILTTLIKSQSPKQVRLILGDLKRSEFFVFKNIDHVEGVYHSADELRPVLAKVKREMIKRGNLLDEQEVTSIDELDKKPPKIVVCIDEIVLLKKETDIMDILEEISSIGRSLGVFLILSMQRPDSNLLDGKLKVNLTVRMGFKTADAINSKIIGTPGAEKLDTAGRMILRINSDLQQIQAPWLDADKARKLLAQYKQTTSNVVPIRKETVKKEDIWGVLTDDET